MGSAMFIVWRESVEAILVIGILYAWLADNGYRNGVRWLWGGVAGGVALAVLLGGAMVTVQSQLAGDALEWFQIAIVFAAALLIAQMVLWMRRHGRSLKSELQGELARAMSQANLTGIAVIAALAVGREGAETAIFLYGLSMERSGVELLSFATAGLFGFLLALITGWGLAHGGRYLSWRAFFRISEALLLLLAAALVVSGTEKLIGLDLLPPLVEPLWDSGFLLDDGAGIGNFIAQFTGYRARPSLTALLAFSTYWAVMGAALRRPVVVRLG